MRNHLARLGKTGQLAPIETDWVVDNTAAVDNAVLQVKRGTTSVGRFETHVIVLSLLSRISSVTMSVAPLVTVQQSTHLSRGRHLDRQSARKVRFA